MSQMRFTIPEILQAVSDARTHADKVRILQNCGTEVLEQVLQYNFHPDIAFNLPEGDCPYKKEKDIPVGKSHSNLYREGRRLYLFIKGQAPNLKPYRREMLFIELLEGIHWTEADMLIAVKDKRLTDLYPGVTYESVRDAYTRILPQEPPKKVAKPTAKELIDDAVVIYHEQRLPEKAQVTKVKSPLELPALPTVTTADSVSEPKPPKKKREMTEKWKASLERAQAARKANLAAKKASSSE
jgi:hypothetical protein